MTDHYLALLSWDVREHWPELAPKDRHGRPEHPFSYGSDHRYFPHIAHKKPVLWIVAVPDYTNKRRLPPSLVAKLHIVESGPGENCAKERRREGLPIRPTDYQHVAYADRKDTKNRYLRINNAFDELTRIHFLNERGKETQIPRYAKPVRRTNPYSHIPTYLENIRRIKPGDENELVDLARRTTEHRTALISYSHRDRTKLARDLAVQLRLLDFAPWIDFEAIPQSETPGRWARFAPPVMRQMLEDGIRQADLMVVLDSPGYRKSQWTRFEWDTADAAGKLGWRTEVIKVPERHGTARETAKWIATRFGRAAWH